MNKMSDDLIVRKSTLNGQGLFTEISIKKGKTVIRVKGKVIYLPEFYRATQARKDDMFRFGPNSYLDPHGELGEYQNHSCRPNSRVVKKDGKLYLVALVDIKKGEEILIDYSTILAKDDYWVMRCSCKTLQCRKLIKRYNLLPKPILAKYKKTGLIPSFIQRVPHDEI